jgi:hypothetical protein
MWTGINVSGQGSMECLCENGNDPSSSIKGGELSG